MSASLRGVLSDLARTPGVTAAFVVDRRGGVIDGTASQDARLEQLGTVARSLLLVPGSLGASRAGDDARCVLIEFERGIVALWPAGPDAALVLVGNHRCILGRARVDGQRAAGAIARAGAAQRVGAPPGPGAGQPAGAGAPASGSAGTARPRVRRPALLLAPAVLGLVAGLAIVTAPPAQSVRASRGAAGQVSQGGPTVLVVPVTLPRPANAGPVGAAVRVAMTPPVPGASLDASRQYLTRLMRSLVGSLPAGWAPDPNGVALLRRAVQDAVPPSVGPLLPAGTRVSTEMIVKVPPGSRSSP